MTNRTGPDWVGILRHGESESNVRFNAAKKAGKDEIGEGVRDPDVALTEFGRAQALAFGQWLRTQPAEALPTVIVCSTFLRPRQTLETVLEGWGVNKDDLIIVFDERLREKDFGIVDGLTESGIQKKYPDLYKQYKEIRKFYHRYPGGESLCDVMLRQRSLKLSIEQEYPGERVLLVCHALVVQSWRVIYEGLSEQEILEIDATTDVPNCSLTSYFSAPTNGRRRKMVRDKLYFVAPSPGSTESVVEVEPRSDREKRSA